MTKETRGAWLTLTVVAVALLVSRGIFAALLPLAPDEAYYWQWSQDLALTYPDHPPLIAWLVRAGTMIFGDTALGVRFFSLLASCLSLFLVFFIGRQVGMTPNLAAIAAILSTLLPMTATGAVLATPDVPLAVCWLLATFALVHLLEKTSVPYWYLFFGAMGLGLLAKHSSLLLFVLLAIALLRSKELRADLRTPHPFFASVLFAIIISPHLISEATAGFPSFRFQAAHLSGQLDGSISLLRTPIRILELLAGQVGLLTPLVALWLLRLPPFTRGARGILILAAALFVPMIATAIAAMFTHPEQNWASLGHPVAAILAVLAVTRTFDNQPIKAKRWVSALLITVSIVTFAIHNHAMRPFLPLPPEKDPVSRTHGWERLAELGPMAKQADAVVCDNYGLAAEFAWVNRKSNIEAVGLDRHPAPASGRLLLLDERNDWGGAALSIECPEKQHVTTLTMTGLDGIPLRSVDVYICSLD